MQAPRPLMPHPLNEERAQKGSASREGREGSYRPISGRRSNAPPAKGPLARPNQVHVPGAHRRQGAFKGHPGRRTSLCGASRACAGPPQKYPGGRISSCLHFALLLCSRFLVASQNSSATPWQVWGLPSRTPLCTTQILPGVALPRDTRCVGGLWVVAPPAPAPQDTHTPTPRTPSLKSRVGRWRLAWPWVPSCPFRRTPHPPVLPTPHPPLIHARTGVCQRIHQWCLRRDTGRQQQRVAKHSACVAPAHTPRPPTSAWILAGAATTTTTTTLRPHAASTHVGPPPLGRAGILCR